MVSSLILKFINKLKNAKVLLGIIYYRFMFKSYSPNSSVDIRIYNPISIKGIEYMTIGNGFKLDYYGVLEAWDKHNGMSFSPALIIGNNVSFGKSCHIACINKIEIGNDVLFGSQVLITDHSHGHISVDEIDISPNKRLLYSKGPVIIKDNVWIGEKVSILPGVTIGNNSIIGANSVVTRSIPDNCVACGNPAKVVKDFNQGSQL